MDNGIYIAVGKQMAQFRNMNVVATNIANSNTTGFQAEHMMFNKYLVNDRMGSNMNFASDISTFRDDTQGTFQTTSNQLDVAIGGEGFFAVQTPLGQRYTRAGNFQINEAGTLVTVEGHPVLDESRGPITLDIGATNLEISNNGTISSDGEVVAGLAVVEFDNEKLLERHGSKYYSAPNEGQQAQNSSVIQGAVENSNVEPVKEMVKLIGISRSTSNTAKYIETLYDLQRRSTTTWTQQR